MERLCAETKKIKHEEVFDFLPLEMAETIVSRLPSQTLIQYLTLSKKWYNIITGTHFVSKHLTFNNSLNDKSLFLLDFTRESSYVLYHDDDQTLTRRGALNAPVEGSNQDFVVSGCCNGLICLSDCVNVVLWNPSIGRAFDLPESHVDPRERIVTRLTFGFVFDLVHNDFKVLRTTHPWEGDVVVEIFRLRTNSWERWTKEITFEGMYGYQVLLKGFAHWIGVDSQMKLTIVSFDVHNEVFGSIQIPETLAGDTETEWADYPVCLFLFEESLVLIHYASEDDVDDGNSRTRYDFWKMEEYGKGESWNLWHSLYCYEARSPLGFRKNGEFLWADDQRRELVSSNLENFTERCLCRYEARVVHSCLNYVDSLALLDTTTTKRWDVGMEI